MKERKKNDIIRVIFQELEERILEHMSVSKIILRTSLQNDINLIPITSITSKEKQYLRLRGNQLINRTFALLGRKEHGVHPSFYSFKHPSLQPLAGSTDALRACHDCSKHGIAADIF